MLSISGLFFRVGIAMMACGSTFFLEAKLLRRKTRHSEDYDKSDQWQQKGQTLLGDDPIGFFGLTLDLSADGNIIAGGAYARDLNDSFIFTGNVRVYEYDDHEEMWKQLGGDINGESQFEFFGRPLGLADKALRLAVATASGQFPDVKVFEYERKLKDWVQLGSNLETTLGPTDDGVTGVAISADGYTVAVGRPQARNNTGFVRVFEYNHYSQDWMRMGDDIEGALPQDRFGFSLAISDGGNTVAVGTPQNSFASTEIPPGFISVYKFSRKYKEWRPLGRPVRGLNPTEKVGINLDLSAEGDVLIVGVPDYDRPTANGTISEIGQARVYRYESCVKDWVPLGNFIDGMSAEDMAGGGVAVDSEGDTVAVGSIGFDQGRGHVRVFQLDDKERSEWKQIGMALNGDNPDDQGFVTALDANGNVVLVGIGGSDIAGNAAGAIRAYALDKGKGSSKSKGKGSSGGKGSSKGK